MIKTETRTINGREFEYTYSTTGMMIERDEVQYSEAYDPAGSGRTYTETTEPIAPEEATTEDYESALNDMGVEL